MSRKTSTSRLLQKQRRTYEGISNWNGTQRPLQADEPFMRTHSRTLEELENLFPKESNRTHADSTQVCTSSSATPRNHADKAEGGPHLFKMRRSQCQSQAQLPSVGVLTIPLGDSIDIFREHLFSADESFCRARNSKTPTSVCPTQSSLDTKHWLFKRTQASSKCEGSSFPH